MTTGFGFFDPSELTVARKPLAVLPECGKCGLFRTCKSPKMPVAGKGRRKILIVGEAPGETEDDLGKPFIGPAGQRLQRELRAADIDIFEDCWVTNAASCRPQRNELPDKAIGHCRPLVIGAIERLKPKVILLLGAAALDSVVTQLWRETTGGIKRWAGFRIPSRRWNAWVCPTYHPSHVMRLEKENRDPVTVLEFAKHVRAACRLRGRPWESVPDDDTNCKVFTDTDAAAKWLAALPLCSKRIAFDYETTTLKPDGPRAEIVCASVSDGFNTAAFPWHGKVVKVMKEILTDSGIKKVGWNIAFEHRWTLAKLGVKVRGWEWDGMLTAHAQDGRGGVTGLKFQTLVRLGVEDYSYAVSSYFESDGGNGPNRIREVNLRDLLLYCAKDSLYEYAICEQQMKELGHE